MKPLILALGLLALSPPPLAHALPEDPGKLTHTKVTRTATIAGKSVTFDLYMPAVSKPAPLVVASHGFARTRANMAGWGKLLASRGYIVAAPGLPGPMPDHQLNGKIVAGLLQWMADQGAVAGSPLKGLADSKRRAVVGHSAGGLASLLAAASDNKINLVVGLDPVDNNNLGAKAMATLKKPALFVLAEPSMCNSSGNAAAMYKALLAPRLMLKVLKANHCDPESPSDGLCALTCGGAADPGRHKFFSRYAMAALDHVLLCQPGIAPWLGGAYAKADKGITLLGQSGFPPGQLGCGGGKDAGIQPDRGARDAGSRDRASTGTETSPRDAAPTPDTNAPSSGEADSGCAVGARGPGGLVLALLVLLALLWRQRFSFFPPLL